MGHGNNASSFYWNQLMKKLYVLITLFTLSGSGFSDDNRENILLDKMYQDIINTMPPSQRKLIDSTSKQYAEKSTGNFVTTSDSLKESPINTSDQNESIKKILQQAQENRDKRIIHFMSTDPKTEEK